MIFSGLFGAPARRMDAAAYHALAARCVVIEWDGFGEKVLQTPEGLMVKIFRRKRLLTSAALFPYARRFVRNARILAERGIPTVTVAEHAYCPQLAKHVVIYHPLSGCTLRSRLEGEGTDREALIAAAAGFIAMLHEKGVYFRSLHFGNIIVPPGELTLGLIDVADMTFRGGPLGAGMRVRNFRHLLRWREDAGHLQAFGGARFVEHYLAEARLGPRRRQAFLELIANTPAWPSPPAAAT